MSLTGDVRSPAGGCVKRFGSREPARPETKDRAGRVSAGVLIAAKMAHGRELAAAFSDESFEAIWFAADERRPITSGDLLRGIASLPDARAARVLASLGLRPNVLRTAVDHAGAEPFPDPAEPYRATANAARVLELAAQDARANGKASFDAEDLLVAIVREANGTGARALHALGISEARLRREIAGAKRPSEH
jgi:ATP-dependent Clp protease ATP-binding subunit ClpA